MVVVVIHMKFPDFRTEGVQSCACWQFPGELIHRPTV